MMAANRVDTVVIDTDSATSPFAIRVTRFDAVPPTVVDNRGVDNRGVLSSSWCTGGAAHGFTNQCTPKKAQRNEVASRPDVGLLH